MPENRDLSAQGLMSGLVLTYLPQLKEERDYALNNPTRRIMSSLLSFSYCLTCVDLCEYLMKQGKESPGN